MNEYIQGLYWSISVVAVMLYSTFWWLGGRPGGRIWRRVIAPAFMGSALMGLAFWLGSFKWFYLGSVPLFFLAAAMGYGGDTIGEKVARRTLWAAVYCLIALPIVISSGAWVLYAFQCVLCFAASLIFGIVNPFHSSPKEEASICFLSTILIPFML